MTTNSLEFRQMQRERIYRTKPWEKSTGAKTQEGKERSKMNALKTSPELYDLMSKYNQLMKQQKEIYNTIMHVK